MSYFLILMRSALIHFTEDRFMCGHAENHHQHAYYITITIIIQNGFHNKYSPPRKWHLCAFSNSLLLHNVMHRFLRCHHTDCYEDVIIYSIGYASGITESKRNFSLRNLVWNDGHILEDLPLHNIDVAMPT